MYFPKYKKGIIAVAALGAILVSGTASAVDNKISSGHVCQPVYPADNDYISYQSGSVMNYKPGPEGTVEVVCPLLRDAIGDPYNVDYVYVSYVDANNEEDLSCQFVYREANGSWYGGGEKSSSGYSSDYQMLSWTTDISTGGYSYYYLYCYIPNHDIGYSRIGRIRYGEEN